MTTVYYTEINVKYILAGGGVGGVGVGDDYIGAKGGCICVHLGECACMHVCVCMCAYNSINCYTRILNP